MSTVPVMQIRRTETGEWLVAAKWPDGTVEDIRGFSTETDANEWIANELQAWLDSRKAQERSGATSVGKDTPEPRMPRSIG